MGEHVGEQRPRAVKQVLRFGGDAQPFQQEVVVHSFRSAQKKKDGDQRDGKKQSAVDVNQTCQCRTAFERGEESVAEVAGERGLGTVGVVVHDVFQ